MSNDTIDLGDHLGRWENVLHITLSLKYFGDFNLTFGDKYKKTPLFQQGRMNNELPKIMSVSLSH
jgi:hypothetical protein